MWTTLAATLVAPALAVTSSAVSPSSGLTEASVVPDLPRVERVATLRLVNATAPSDTLILLEGCIDPIQTFAIFGLAEGSANEEWIRARGECSCEAWCAISAPLRYEHGAAEPVSLMPSHFQPPDAGRILNASPDSYAHEQHARAAAVVAAATHWISLAQKTVSGGPDKLALRRLLIVLALTLLLTCFAALLYRCATIAMRRAGKA